MKKKTINDIVVKSISIDKFVAVNKIKSILRIRGEHTIIYSGFIYWN